MDSNKYIRKPISIGALEILPLFASPMAGYTDKIYRQFARKFGAEMVFTEMISAEGLIFSSRLTKKYIDFSPEEMPIGIQFFTSNPSMMEKAAKIISRMSPGFAVVDINMACPVRKVIKNGAGAALLNNHTLACDIVRSAQQSGMPVSVKVRKGFDDDNARHILELIHKIAELKVSFITVHPRTAKQMYSGRADWGFLDKVSREIDIPVIGSGDIFDVQRAMDMLVRTGVSGLTVARGAIGNFLLFSQIASIMKGNIFSEMQSIKDRAKILIEFFGQEVIYRGESKTAKWGRKFLVAFSKNLPNGNELRKKLSAVKTMYDIESWLAEAVIAAKRSSNIR